MNWVSTLPNRPKMLFGRHGLSIAQLLVIAQYQCFMPYWIMDEMKSLSKSDQALDYIASMHNMVIIIMLLIGLGVGFLIYHYTGKWYAVLLCFFGSFLYPLVDKFWRQIRKW
jgi:hypothetical protein